MDNNDKLFNTIKEASHKQEAKDFAALDKVWSRVEDKLDHKALKKENKLWKKIAVAASFLLLLTIGYQIFKPTAAVNAIDNKITVADTIRQITMPIETQKAIVNTDVPNPAIKENAGKILEKALQKSAVVASEKVVAPAPMAEKSVVLNSVPVTSEDVQAVESDKTNGHFIKSKKSDALSVRRSADFSEQEVSKEQIPKKDDPLYVVNGKPLTGKSKNDTAKQSGLSNLDPDEIEDIVVLKEPLYIINGSQYSELELFGPDPTSPYAPLNQQEIETISILQGEKATAAYGQKGSKGVVIITTKNGKPIKSASGKGN